MSLEAALRAGSVTFDSLKGPTTKAARFPRAVVLSLDKQGVDIRDFRWRLATGRLAKDYEIMLLLGARTLSQAVGLVNEYIYRDMDLLRDVGMAELKKKYYLDASTMRKARQIAALMKKPLIGD